MLLVSVAAREAVYALRDMLRNARRGPQRQIVTADLADQHTPAMALVDLVDPQARTGNRSQCVGDGLLRVPPTTDHVVSVQQQRPAERPFRAHGASCPRTTRGAAKYAGSSGEPPGGLVWAAGVNDLVIAATAIMHGAVVRHHDADYEKIVTVSELNQIWVVPRGSSA